MNKLEKLSKNHVLVGFEQSGKNKGITLVALVITIIVLIILAGVSISAVINKEGIITNAKDAKNTYENSKKEEEKVLSNLEKETIDAKVEQVFKANGITYKFKNGYLTGVSMGRAEELYANLTKVRIYFIWYNRR